MKNERHKGVILTCLVFACCFFLLTVSASADNQVMVKKNLPYIEDESGKTPEKQKLDVYFPSEGNNLPVVLFFHGGAWQKGDKKQYSYLGKTLAKNGIVAVIANYRLSPDVKHPSHAYDCASAFAWTYNNIKEYRGDPGKIFLMGHSAGAHLASLIALDPEYLDNVKMSPDNVYGVIAISGVYLLGGRKETEKREKTSLLTKKLIIPAFGSDPEVLKDASPIFYARGDTPPILLLYGEKENVAIKLQAKIFAGKIKKEEAPVQIEAVPGKNHFSIISGFADEDDPTAEKAIHFIKFRSYD